MYIYIYIGECTMNYIKRLGCLRNIKISNALADRNDCCYKMTASDNYVIESSK